MIKKVLTLILLINLIGCASSEQYSDDFNFVFSYGVLKKNVLNTFDNRYTKDLVIDGVKTTELYLTKEEKKNIYTYMKEIGLFQYPDEVEGMKMIPESGYLFEINNNGINRSINWVGEFSNSKRDKEFKHLTRMIIELIESKESYQSLPKSNGYYE